MPSGLPCEFSVWYVLPSLRRELALALISEHGLSQRRTADLLGLTEAAVSQYVHGKRGGIRLSDEERRSVRFELAPDLLAGKGTLDELVCPYCKRVSKRICGEVAGDNPY